MLFIPSIDTIFVFILHIMITFEVRIHVTYYSILRRSTLMVDKRTKFIYLLSNVPVIIITTITVKEMLHWRLIIVFKYFLKAFESLYPNNKEIHMKTKYVYASTLALLW